MNVVLRFTEKLDMKIRQVAVIGSFNEFQPSKGKMEQVGKEWLFECTLPAGEYFYKFFINEELMLNDPWNNIFEADESGEVWSLLIVNHQGLRFCNPVRRPLRLECYYLSQVTDRSDMPGCRFINITRNGIIQGNFHFEQFAGVHSLTMAWYSPKENLISYVEKILYPADQNKMRIEFHLDRSSLQSLCSGEAAKLRIFVDGAYSRGDEYYITLKEYINLQ